MVLSLQVVIGGLIILLREPLAGVYTSDPAVLPVVVSSLMLVGVMVVLDGAHNVMQGALRAGGDVFRPLAVYIVSYWFIGVPLAYLLGNDAGWGTLGLLAGNAVGYLLAAIALAWRFRLVARREVKPLT
jgi:MATE family multidrug resistance protein